jgi:nicotinamidase-related amidase
MYNLEFLSWLSEWNKNLKKLDWENLGNPKTVAIISVDMVVGFCHKGPLSSENVKNIIPNVVEVFKKAHNSGVENFLLLQDTHDKNAEEFHAYPPHCIEGTDESENIPELANLSFVNLYTTFKKNSLSPAYDTEFDKWIKDHPEVTTFIIVGDCTDLCVYTIAMHLRMSANALRIARRVIIPENSVATYDMSVEKAKELTALPHDAKLLHDLFLYHMALNAIEVYAKVG